MPFSRDSKGKHGRRYDRREERRRVLIFREAILTFGDWFLSESLSCLSYKPIRCPGCIFVPLSGLRGPENEIKTLGVSIE